eukprot:198043-Alexandrium_andersonii.AAC.1
MSHRPKTVTRPYVFNVRSPLILLTGHVRDKLTPRTLALTNVGFWTPPCPTALRRSTGPELTATLHRFCPPQRPLRSD